MNQILPTVFKKPELLSPAGNFEKMKIAFQYGADAVFVGGKVFGLRKYADNFTNDELRAAMDLAHGCNKKVYVVLNGFAHNEDLSEIRYHLDDLQRIAPDGFIISDWAVAQLATQHTSVPLHVSTQASVTNWRTVQVWQSVGAKRIILAREVDIAACREILSHCDVELEIFVHGSMCASYSGKCVISNYSAGRDSNRGGCIQSCRHQYAVTDGDQTLESHIMNAKDLIGVRHISDIIQSGITSLKIEGRMKSTLYVANVTSIYRNAIDMIYDALVSGNSVSRTDIEQMESNLALVSNRGFSSGGFDHRPEADAVHRDFGGYSKSIQLMGNVKSVSGHTVLLETKSVLNVGDELGCLNHEHSIQIESIQDLLRDPIDCVAAGCLAWVTLSAPVPEYSILIRSNL